MPEGQEATVTEVDATDFPDQDRMVSGVFDIGPSGSEFEVPVTIGLPIDLDTPEGTVIVVMRFDESSSAWEPLEGSYIIGTSVFAATEHFSVFAALSTSEAAACNNMWFAGPAAVPLFLEPGNIVVSGGVRTKETLGNARSSQFALDSFWTVEGCDTTVTGFFGEGTSSDGRWKDWSHAGGGGPIPQAADGSFSFDLTASDGPYIGLIDPCHAASDGAVTYNLNVFIGGDCTDMCRGVTCTGNTGNPCTSEVCNPSNGMCEVVPVSGSCGSGNAGKCVEDVCVVEIPMTGGASGNTVCAAQGMTCRDTPVFATPEAACLAFHPSAGVTRSSSGWRQGIYCNDNEGAACTGRVDTCHSCPACLDTGLDCGTANSMQIESLYAVCVP
ncbi:MAG: hypothetical protein DRJ42_17765 [Deltaproteobacteria bacterium]|nr:MAG: hypothetical protein DRJ42_17765 [Deltaproteobacteria bacterium]